MEHTSDLLAVTARLPATTARCLDRLRNERPRIHVLTNFVAMNLSANVLLATGAVPSMTFRADSMPDFIATSQSLVVNLGMLEAEREAAIRRAVPLAKELGRPWVLDPVKVERSGHRRDFALGLLMHKPTVLRGNHGEIASLAGGEVPEAAARRLGGIVAATGAADIVTDGHRTIELANGSPLMDRVTAMGCACSALLGAFLAVERDPLLAAAAALLAYGVAGEVAGERARGPGSFVPEFLDALHGLDESLLIERGRVS
jgi:hydroxyethylthiazole kinase